MLRNKVGTQVIILGGWANGRLAMIVENHNPADSWVAVIINGEHGLYSPNIYEFAESDLMSLDELRQLRAENERLKAALETIYAEISQWSQIQTPPDAATSVAVIARIESLVSEVLEPNE